MPGASGGAPLAHGDPIIPVTASAAKPDFEFHVEDLAPSASALACAGGKAFVAEFDFSSSEFSSQHELRVFAEAGRARTLDQELSLLRSEGLDPVALINGGYFDPATSLPYSYFKSSINGVELERNSAQGPRACMRHDSVTGGFFVEMGTTENYQRYVSLPGAEIFCAGPELVDGGQDISKTHFCSEHFDPACRADKLDPGVGYLENNPRSGSCITSSGAWKVFALGSEAQRCGGSLPALTALMIREGCVSAINHDGGGSTKLYLNDGTSPVVHFLGAEGDSTRAIPVWIAVLRDQGRASRGGATP